MKIVYTVEADVPIAEHRRSLYRRQLESMLDLFTSGKVRVTGEQVLEEGTTAAKKDTAAAWRCSKADVGVGEAPRTESGPRLRLLHSPS